MIYTRLHNGKDAIIEIGMSDSRAFLSLYSDNELMPEMFEFTPEDIEQLRDELTILLDNTDYK